MPSEVVALADNLKHGWGFDPDLLQGIIRWHHKVFPYRGPDAKIIEACRKADWIDASQGLIRKGLSAQQVERVRDAIPDHDFPQVLQRLAGELGGWALTGNLRVLRHVFKL